MSVDNLNEGKSLVLVGNFNERKSGKFFVLLGNKRKNFEPSYGPFSTYEDAKNALDMKNGGVGQIIQTETA